MTTKTFDDYAYMGLCLLLARRAAAWGEVPVGAIIVHHNPQSGEAQIIGRGLNVRELTQDPTAHAELIAIKQASEHLGQWRLINCDLYVTLEPCAMCAGGIVNARVRRVIYGCHDLKSGATRSLYQIADDSRLNHRAQVTSGVRAQECVLILQKFFQARRAQKRRNRLS